MAFASYAVALADALLGVQVPDHKQRAPHLARLNGMLGPVSLVVAEEQGRPQAHVASPSLLGALAAMAFFDIRGGVRFAHCQRCAKLFCSPRTDRRFCSPRCQTPPKSAAATQTTRPIASASKPRRASVRPASRPPAAPRAARVRLPSDNWRTDLVSPVAGAWGRAGRLPGGIAGKVLHTSIGDGAR